MCTYNRVESLADTLCCLGALDDRPKPIRKGDDLPYRAKMAFRRDVFDKVGLFDVSRGRKGAVLVNGEDGELFHQILAAGFEVMFHPQARVKHHVEAFRVERWYFAAGALDLQCYACV